MSAIHRQRVAMTGLALVAWLAACSGTGTPAVPPPDDASIRLPDLPKPDLEQRIRAFTASEPIACGEQSHTFRTERISDATVDAWLACAQRATAARRSFHVIVGYPGIDWWTARGWVGDADGTLHEFVYTISFPSQQTTLELRRCGSIAKRQSRFAPFICVPPQATGLG